MEVKVKQLQLHRVLMAALALALVVAVAAGEAISSVATAATTQVQTLPGCISSCGDVTNIPYPFGIGNSSSKPDQPCYLEPKFSLDCNDSKLYFRNLPVLDIAIEGQMDVMFNVTWVCYNTDGSRYGSNESNPVLDTASFSISTNENKLQVVGCNSYGFLYGDEDGSISTRCTTKCFGDNSIKNGTCSSGIGCCQVDVPPGVRNITYLGGYALNQNESLGTCVYSFAAKQGSYNFSYTDLQGFHHTGFPLVLDWTVGNKSCNASKSSTGYPCKNNSDCFDKGIDYGYRCTCMSGYEGNPYHPDGCTDIDECKISNHTCIDENHCRNINGSYQCFCPKWQSGDGTKNGGCSKLTEVLIGAGAGIIILFVGIASLYLTYQKRKLMKLKEKFFRENGGFILLQKLSTREDSSQIAKIFTEDELKKATDNYDESLIIGRGGYGIVFKGVLLDKRIVAIKKSRIADKSQIEQFINEVVVLSQINHRNVVKLLGCCLETEVPLLVYEFVSNGTLYDFIHSDGKVDNVTWKTRLRIAAEAAGALSYLHSAASVPIIHRDVKGANILLDDTYTAKVSDFGASKLVPLDQAGIATMVQGTLGYLDPEYMQSQHLTEKSDVYSFGVVLVELLTGEKPISFDRPEEKRSLAMHFLYCLKEDCMFDVVQAGMMNEENKQEIKEVSILAAKCLRLKGEERPSMKEVAMELEGLRLMEKPPWTNREQHLEETRYLLHKEASNIYSSSLQNTWYDPSRDHVPLVALNGGR
ncbi:wall-associated receptor kinase 2-like [Lotus japonicus]|uniref:wall-associated receptor kinase 2-like n=1 Tax=Lotus japonicus TaxID=34305 RepID=UPI00258571D1|nr:wall-associated receptor kinase 2-like [Lotus japonicus]